MNARSASRSSAFRALVRKDLVLFFSNRRALLVSLAAPIAIAAFFGSLFGGSKDSERARIPVAIVDLDGSETSRAIVQAMSADASFDVHPADPAAAADAVRRGKLRAVVTLPVHFGADASRSLFGTRERPVIDVRYDPSQAVELQVVEGLLVQHVMEGVFRTAFSAEGGVATITDDARRRVVDSATLSDESKKRLTELFDSIERVRSDPAAATEPQAPGGGVAFRLPYTTNEVAVQAAGAATNYNPYAHAFAGMGVQFILFMGIDLGIRLLQTRRMGLWQRLRAAPLSRGFLLASQVGSGAIVASLLFAAIMGAGIAFFGVRVAGSTVGFVGLIVAFGVLTAAFGLFIAALGRTPEATRGLAIFATLVMVMLGGAWVPAFIFPKWLQTISLVVPTRWAVDGFDAVTWRGLGLDAAAWPILVMLGFAAAFAIVAAWRFDWDEK